MQYLYLTRIQINEDKEKYSFRYILFPIPFKQNGYSIAVVSLIFKTVYDFS